MKSTGTASTTEVIDATTTALAPATETSPAADPLLDDAVGYINRVVTTKGLETARLLGDYLLKTFFDNDAANVRSRSGKETTFRKLAERDDLQCSFSFLWSAVAVVEQLRLLPEGIADTLPMSHHKLLLPIKSTERKVQLAKEAIEKKLGKREFEDRVRKVQSKQSKGEKRGRKPAPEVVKTLRRLLKALDGLDAWPGHSEIITATKTGDSLRLRQAIEDALERLGALHAVLFTDEAVHVVAKSTT